MCIVDIPHVKLSSTQMSSTLVKTDDTLAQGKLILALNHYSPYKEDSVPPCDCLFVTLLEYLIDNGCRFFRF